ncbi:hypothetical protein vseg_000876 [Gypsophila vaccaria]
MLKPNFAWKDFKEAIEAQYSPQQLKWQMEEQFMNISMEGMSFQDYHDQFVKLSRFSKRIVFTENDLVQFYIRHMVGKLRTSMLQQPITNISKAYQTALSLNASILEEEAESKWAARRNFTPHVSKTNFIKKPQIPRPNFRQIGGFKFYGNSYKPGGDISRCPGCQKPRHPNTKCDRSPVEC